MGRECAGCGEWCSNSRFSRNQWFKGDGYSRCRDCVEGYNNKNTCYSSAPVYRCSNCFREFNNQNELNMHMQVHRPRNVACPICGEARFKSGANAVQHVESGYCSGCRGKDLARSQIYNFAQNQPAMRRFMTDTPMIADGNSYDDDVPDFPYHCPECTKSFRQLSQLLQHQDQKHNNNKFQMIGF